MAAAIGLVYAWLGAGMSFIGDDIGYYSGMSASIRHFWEYPLWVGRHILSTNGRMANLISPIFYHLLPQWLFCIVNGAAYAAFYYLMARMLPWGRRALTARLAVMAFVAFTFPWWDVFMLFIVALNYLWTTVAVLLFLVAIYKYEYASHGAMRWALLLFAVFAGWMHEAAGLPLAGALLIYAIWVKGWKTLSKMRRDMIVAFCVGALMGMLSPAMWRRIFMDKIPDDTPLGLVVKSCWIGCALVVAVAVLWLARPDKAKTLMRGPFCVFFLATCASMCIVAAGGILWRSGFFAQVFALLAFGWWLRPKAGALPRVAAITLSAVLIGAMAAHFLAFCVCQTIMNAELSEALSRYAADPSKEITLPYHNEPDLPWHVLRKTRGVPDTDDFYLLSTVTSHYPGLTDPRPFGCFYSPKAPVAADSIFPASFIPESYGQPDFMPIEGGWYYDALPEGATPLRDSAGRYSITVDGREHIVTPLHDGTYFINPRDLDPSGSY